MKALDSRIRALTADTSPEISDASDELFKGLHRAVDDRPIERDLRYGPDPRHLLDIHLPASIKAPAPVLLFIHGGGFVKGERSTPGSFYYDNIGAWATSHGLILVSMTYRLAPGHQWPSGAQDAELAVAWLKSHIAARGGNPGAIIVMGHSAGAAHAADFVCGHGNEERIAPPVAGCILMSGTYDVVVGPANKSYFGEDAQQYPMRSTAGRLPALSMPILLAVAEFDPPRLQRQFALAVNAFVNAGRPLPCIAYAMGHNHFTVTHHLGTSDNRFGDQLLEFVSRFGEGTPDVTA